MLIALIEEKDMVCRLFDEGLYKSDEKPDKIAIWFNYNNYK